ncbi:hypothetical protein V8F33_002122 [Rhypophila sp. PSN 637]
MFKRRGNLMSRGDVSLTRHTWLLDRVPFTLRYGARVADWNSNDISIVGQMALPFPNLNLYPGSSHNFKLKGYLGLVCGVCKGAFEADMVLLFEERPREYSGVKKCVTWLLAMLLPIPQDGVPFRPSRAFFPQELDIAQTQKDSRWKHACRSRPRIPVPLIILPRQPTREWKIREVVGPGIESGSTLAPSRFEVERKCGVQGTDRRQAADGSDVEGNHSALSDGHSMHTTNEVRHPGNEKPFESSGSDGFSSCDDLLQRPVAHKDRLVVDPVPDMDMVLAPPKQQK